MFQTLLYSKIKPQKSYFFLNEHHYLTFWLPIQENGYCSKTLVLYQNLSSAHKIIPSKHFPIVYRNFHESRISLQTKVFYLIFPTRLIPLPFFNYCSCLLSSILIVNIRIHFSNKLLTDIEISTYQFHLKARTSYRIQ